LLNRRPEFVKARVICRRNPVRNDRGAEQIRIKLLRRLPAGQFLAQCLRLGGLGRKAIKPEAHRLDRARRARLRQRTVNRTDRLARGDQALKDIPASALRLLHLGALPQASWISFSMSALTASIDSTARS